MKLSPIAGVAGQVSRAIGRAECAVNVPAWRGTSGGDLNHADGTVVEVDADADEVVAIS